MEWILVIGKARDFIWKRKMVFLGGVIVLLGVIGIGGQFLFYSRETGQDFFRKKDIVDKIKNKEDFLIFLSRENSNCQGNCVSGADILESLASIYDIKYDSLDLDKDQETVKEIQDLIMFPTEYTPSIVVIKNGEFISENGFSTSSLVKDILFQNGFLEKKYDDSSKSIGYEELDKIAAGKTNQLVMVDDQSVKGEEQRKILSELASNKEFDYHIVGYGFAGGTNLSLLLNDYFGEEFHLPMLMVVKEGKIVDTQEFVNKRKTEEFLNKNKFI